MGCGFGRDKLKSTLLPNPLRKLRARSSLSFFGALYTSILFYVPLYPYIWMYIIMMVVCDRMNASALSLYLSPFKSRKTTQNIIFTLNRKMYDKYLLVYYKSLNDGNLLFIYFSILIKYLFIYLFSI